MIFRILTAIYAFCFHQTAVAHICTCWLSHDTKEIMALFRCGEIELGFSEK